MKKTNPRAQIGKSSLTRRNVEVLEAVFHQGNPYLKKVGPRELPQFIHMGALQSAGGAVNRMVDELKRRGYITSDSVPSGLTTKGLEALKRDKMAMKAIDEREMEGRLAKRKRMDERERTDRQLADAKRDEQRTQREAESRKTRLEKLHELLDPLDATVFSTMEDDALLNLADKVTAIETIY